MPAHFIDVNSLSSVLLIISTVFAFLVALNRHRIARHYRRLVTSFRATAKLVSDNEQLAEKLVSAEQRNIEWAEQFENVDRLRIAISEQLDRLKAEIDDVRKRLSTKDDLIDLLKGDRDSLLTSYRLLIGQMHANRLAPDYSAPALRSLSALPGPDLPINTDLTKFLPKQ
jgi:predicted nuclease with TOPRIM domain